MVFLLKFHLSALSTKYALADKMLTFLLKELKKMLSKHFKKAICLALSAPPLVSTFETKSCKTCLTFCLYSAALHRNFEPFQIVEN